VLTSLTLTFSLTMENDILLLASQTYVQNRNQLKKYSKQLKFISSNAHRFDTKPLQQIYFESLSQITTELFLCRYGLANLRRSIEKKKRSIILSGNDHPNGHSPNQENLHTEMVDQHASPEFQEPIVNRRPILKFQPIHKRKHFRKNRTLRQYFIFISFFVLENLQIYFFRNIAFKHVVVPLFRNIFYFLFDNCLNLEKFFIGSFFSQINLLFFVFYFVMCLHNYVLFFYFVR